MATQIYFVICVLQVILISIIGNEICLWETFEASCSAKDEVIVMASALYGRMKYGRCIEHNYGHVGCSADVLIQSDSRCSGRSKCAIEIPDKIFDTKTFCPKDLIRYMIGNYSCVKVLSPIDGSCTSEQHSGILSSLMKEETGCGQPDTPWELKVGEGQRFNLTLYNFATENSSDVIGGPSGQCHVYAVLKDIQAGISETICSSKARISHAYLSHGNHLEVRLITHADPKRTKHFLLKYEVLGCATIAAPPGGWVERSDNALEMGCFGSNTRWRLTCDGSKWNGDYSNCTSTLSGNTILQGGGHSDAISIVIILGLALLIGLAIFAIGMICLRRHSTQLMRNNRPSLELKKDDVYGQIYMRKPGSRSSAEYAYVDDYSYPVFSPPLTNVMAKQGDNKLVICENGGRESLSGSQTPHYYELDASKSVINQDGAGSYASRINTLQGHTKPSKPIKKSQTKTVQLPLMASSNSWSSNKQDKTSTGHAHNCSNRYTD